MVVVFGDVAPEVFGEGCVRWKGRRRRTATMMILSIT